MGQLRFYPGLRETLIQRGGDAFTLAITDDSYVGWKLDIHAHLCDGPRYLGSVLTVPRRLSGAQQSRIVCAGGMPGAQAWSVDVSELQVVGDASALPITLDLSVGTGMQSPAFIDYEYRPKRIFSGAAGGVTLEPWQRLASWYARATVAASIQIGANPPIALAAGVALAADAGGPNDYGIVVQCVNTAAFVLQVEG